MPILKGPLFSLTASGSLNRHAIYLNCKRGARLKRYAIPSNPRTPAQTSIRAMTRFLSQEWKRLFSYDFSLEENQASWQKFADYWNVSPYHAYFRVNSLRWASFQPPLVRGDDAPPSPFFTNFSFSLSKTPSAVTIRIARAIPFSSFCILVFHGFGSPPTISRNSCIAVLHINFSFFAPSLPAAIFHHLYLPAGNHYYQTISCRSNGDHFSPRPVQSITIP